MLLTTDWHLTANDADKYRWHIFEELYRLMQADPLLFVLGDLTDRRDRHPSDLVNGLITQFRDLIQRRKAEVVVLCGNHDRPLHAEQPYWSFLNDIDGLTFITKPTARGDLILLPWAEDPRTEWQDIDFNLYSAAFCHQTFVGSSIGEGRYTKSALSVSDVFPPHVKVYSGDVHIPQRLGQLEYVGAPHPIKYGDDYQCRVLRLSGSYGIIERIELRTPRKSVIEIASADDLRNVNLVSGDSARIRLTLPIDKLSAWRQEEDRITEWARQRGVNIASIEPMIAIEQQFNMPELIDDEAILTAFAEAEGLSEDLITAGLTYLREGVDT